MNLTGFKGRVLDWLLELGCIALACGIIAIVLCAVMGVVYGLAVLLVRWVL